jgi:hypothetical protein
MKRHGLPAAAQAAMLLLTVSCAAGSGTRSAASRPSVVAEPGEGWRSGVSAEDEIRIEALRTNWAAALAYARKAGFGRRISQEGRLLDPAPGLDRPAPTPGAYACRAILIGSTGTGARAYSAGRSGFCYVGAEGEGLSLATETVRMRVGGYLWEERAGKRLIFLGAVAPPKGGPPPAYGTDPARNAVGLLERIGDFRFRLILHWPQDGQLAVFDMAASPR